MKFEFKKYKTVPFEFQKHSRNVPESELIADVIAVAKKMGKDKLARDDYSKYGKYSSSTLCRRFKSWTNVLEKAGLKPTIAPKNMQEVDLFKNIAEVWITLGRQPSAHEMKTPLSKYSIRPYENRFGTWMNALEKFVEYENSGTSEEDIVKEEIQPIEEINKPVKEEKDTRTISLRQRFSVFLRDGFRCVSCGKSPVTHPGVVLHCDHILPWSKGGETIDENLETKCKQCNLGKGNAFNA